MSAFHKDTIAILRLILAEHQEELATGQRRLANLVMLGHPVGTQTRYRKRVVELAEISGDFEELLRFAETVERTDAELVELVEEAAETGAVSENPYTARPTHPDVLNDILRGLRLNERTKRALADSYRASASDNSYDPHLLHLARVNRVASLCWDSLIRHVQLGLLDTLREADAKEDDQHLLISHIPSALWEAAAKAAAVQEEESEPAEEALADGERDLLAAAKDAEPLTPDQAEARECALDSDTEFAVAEDEYLVQQEVELAGKVASGPRPFAVGDLVNVNDPGSRHHGLRGRVFGLLDDDTGDFVVIETGRFGGKNTFPAALLTNHQEFLASGAAGLPAVDETTGGAL